MFSSWRLWFDHVAFKDLAFEQMCYLLFCHGHTLLLGIRGDGHTLWNLNSYGWEFLEGNHDDGPHKEL